MKIENLRSEKHGNRRRVAATVIWEDCDRPVQELYFETDEAFAEDLSCNPHAFLVASVVPAMHYGEQRVFVDAEVCPELRVGLITAMSWIRHWYYKHNHKIVRIEARTQSDIPTSPTPQRAGFFFSGGIDSFATLRANRPNFPPEHPWSIKDGLLVYGLELDKPEAFEHVVHSLSGVAQEAGITFIPVYTNIYLNYRQEDAVNEFSFWIDEFEGAALAAVAHAFSRRLSVVSIASTDDISSLALINRQNFKPHGSHPLLDPNYSSSDLRIRHDGIELSNFTKTKLIANWDLALQHLRVCNKYKHYRPDMLNCGRCEKCVKTMLALLALDVLDKTHAFPVDDVSEELVAKLIIKPREGSVDCDYLIYHNNFRELITPLSEKGRHDLVRAIKDMIRQSLYHKTSWKAKVRQFDKEHLNGNLARFKRLVFP
jgi:hypothetical protein